MEMPMSAIRDQVGRAINVIVQQSRMRDGSRKITAISEIIGIEEGKIQMQDLFRFEYNPNPSDPKLGQIMATGRQPQFLQRLAERGVTIPPEVFQR